MTVRDSRNHEGEREPGRGFQGWSVTTWLIALCCIVFATDGFMPAQMLRFVEVEQRVDMRAEGATTYAPMSEEWRRHLNGLPEFRWPIIEESTGREVGYAHFVKMAPLQRWLYFSTAKGFLGMELWRLIGFQFLHANLLHLFFNMLALYFFGPLVEEHLGRKRFLAFYVLCGIFGALLYLALNLAGVVVAARFPEAVPVPGLLFNDPRVPLVGASAGVFGVLMAGAYIAPHERVYAMFVIPVELRPLSYLLVAMSLYTLITGGANAGGEAGHIGGAIAGAYFIRQPHHLHGFFDFLGRADPTSSHYRGPGGSRRRASALARADLDRVLLKFATQGRESLTDEERRLLHEASRRRAPET